MVSHPKLFALVMVITTISAASLFAIHSWLSAVTVPLTNAGPDETAVIIEVAVNSTDPLILSVNLKSLFYRDLRFSRALLMDYNQTVVAECRGKFYGGYLGGHVEPLFELPAGLEKNLLLNFSTAFPFGSYTLGLPFGEPPHPFFLSPYFVIS